MINFFIWTRII